MHRKSTWSGLSGDAKADGESKRDENRSAITSAERNTIVKGHGAQTSGTDRWAQSLIPCPDEEGCNRSVHLSGLWSLPIPERKWRTQDKQHNQRMVIYNKTTSTYTLTYRINRLMRKPTAIAMPTIANGRWRTRSRVCETKRSCIACQASPRATN